MEERKQGISPESQISVGPVCLDTEEDEEIIVSSAVQK